VDVYKTSFDLGKFCGDRIAQTLASFSFGVAICISRRPISRRGFFPLACNIGPSRQHHRRHPGVFKALVWSKKEADTRNHMELIALPRSRDGTLSPESELYSVELKFRESGRYLLRLARALPEPFREKPAIFAQKNILDSRGLCGAFGNQGLPKKQKGFPGKRRRRSFISSRPRGNSPCAKQGPTDPAHDFYAVQTP